MTTPFKLAGALGIRIVEVEDLGPDARYIPSLRLVIVEANLTDERRGEIMSHYLPGFFDLPPDPLLRDLRPAG